MTLHVTSRWLTLGILFHEPVAQALVIPFAMVVLKEFQHGVPQRLLTKEDEPPRNKGVRTLSCPTQETSPDPFVSSVRGVDWRCSPKDGDD